MKMYVGITDHDWFKLLRQEKCDEVNFWTPGSTPFKALQMNDLFLFKLTNADVRSPEKRHSRCCRQPILSRIRRRDRTR